MDARHREFLAVMGHLYLVNGKADRAVTVYTCLHSEFPEDDSITLALAFAQLQDGEFSKAVELAEEVAASGSTPAGGSRFDLFIRAKALWGKGDKQAARREMKAFLATATLDAPVPVGAVESGKGGKAGKAGKTQSEPKAPLTV